MRLSLVVSALLVATPGLLAQEAAPADTIVVDWAGTLDGLQTVVESSPGHRFVVRCPPNGSAGAIIWGTGTYTSDSALCVAAAHAGTLTLADGGHAVVEVAAGQAEYAGTSRNGVASLAYPEWHTSFRFPGAPEEPVGGAIVVHRHQGDWYTTARQVNAGGGSRVRFTCSPGGAGGNVWGTDVYTDDSSICEAAVHAGVIERAEGGEVVFELTGPRPSFAASERHGVSTLSYPAWPGSFRFVTEDAP